MLSNFDAGSRSRSDFFLSFFIRRFFGSLQLMESLRRFKLRLNKFTAKVERSVFESDDLIDCFGGFVSVEST